ncbi:MAG: tetratricopeptide repeat protein [Candidatus Contendobacter sp.]|nr:tetratricopeptide repeat protein [Candidatus Contendobacter sp.]
MNMTLKQSLGILALTIGVAGCANMPFSQPQPTAKKPVARAPVVDRSARQPAPDDYPQPAYRQPSPAPQDDPLMPREYSSAYPATPGYPNSTGRAPATPQARPYPPAASDGYYPQPPAYPPGAATQPAYPPAARPYPTAPAESYDRTAPAESYDRAAPAESYDRAAPAESYDRAAPPVGNYGRAPSRETNQAYGAAPGALPEPQPVIPQTPQTPHTPPQPRPAAPAPAEPAVAMVPPATPTAPAPRPVQPAPPASLPPAEITREGSNQAVAALLESADKYVKSNQLDKAGAALERALRVEPRNAGIWHDLAQIRLHQGQYQQAESLASKSNNLASGNRALQSRNWKVIALSRKASGNSAGAEEAEAQAAQLR